MKKVKVFTSAGCPHCDEVKSHLANQSIDFEEIDLTQNQKESALLVQKTGYTVVPQIQIGDKFVIGFDREKIEELLQED